MKKCLFLLTLFSTSVLANSLGQLDLKLKTERELKSTIEPVLQKYCADDCKILTIKAEIKNGSNAELYTPGFEEPQTADDLAVDKAEVKILMDEKLGKTRKTRVTDLLNQLFESFEYPVTIQMKSTRFPSEAESSQKISEIREKIRKNFESSVNEVFQKFCPRNCMFTQFELDTEVVSLEESQSGNPSDYIEQNGTALRIDQIGGTLVFDKIIPENDQKNLLELVQIKAHAYSNLELKTKTIDFPKIKGEESEGWESPFLQSRPGDLTKKVNENVNHKNESNSQTQNEFKSNSQSEKFEKNSHDSKMNSDLKSTESKTDNREEKFSRFEKIERVENGDVLHTEFQQLKWFGGAVSFIILTLLGFLIFRGIKTKNEQLNDYTFKQQPLYPTVPPPSYSPPSHPEEDHSNLVRTSKVEPALRFQIQNLKDQLITLFVENPRVTKYVFTKILIEEGIETTASYISLFGETIVLEILKDPSLQSDINHLIEFYATTPIEISDEDQIKLLKKLQSRAVAGKLSILSQNNKSYFEFLSDLDASQIYALIKDECMAVKGLIVTQTDHKKRSELIREFSNQSRTELMAELAKMDYLPKDYIRNVSFALNRKLKENSSLNTESLASQEVLMSLLEDSGVEDQNDFIRDLQESNPANATKIKSQFVTLETLQYLPPAKIVEVCLTLKHDELLILFKGMKPNLFSTVMKTLPEDLASDLKDELASTLQPSKEQLNAVERKVIHRIKSLASEKIINLSEVNDKIFNVISLQPNQRKAS